MTSAADYGVGDAYDLSAEAWVSGPEQVYRHLAQALVEATPVPMAGLRVLDLGAGTGVAGQAALAAGAARVVAVDLAAAMLRSVVDRAPGPGTVAAVQGDACALPFAAASFDVVLAAMSLGHVPQPERAVREARRVAPALVASAFAPGWTHPAKAAVDTALAVHGYRTPEWYVRFKAEVEPLVDDPERLHALASAAGYPRVGVRVVDVPTGLVTPTQLAGWRLGMAHLAPFMASLGPDERAAARRTAEAALVGAPPLVVPLVLLQAN